VPIFGFALGILLGSYFALCFGLYFGKSLLEGSEIWDCLEFLSLWMQILGQQAVLIALIKLRSI
jgi:hypothetical protein